MIFYDWMKFFLLSCHTLSQHFWVENVQIEENNLYFTYRPIFSAKLQLKNIFKNISIELWGEIVVLL